MLGRCNISDDDMVKMLPPFPKEVGWWDDLLEENADEGLREVFFS